MPKRAEPLSPSAIANARPKDKPYKLPDGRGMFLLVQPDGSRLWRWRYRRPISGKENMLALGAFPEVSLRLAREKREEARALLAAGIDPGEQRKAEKAAGTERAANSFEVVTREWLAKQTWVESYRVKVEAWMDNDVYPYIGGRPVAELTAPEFLRVARRIEERGAVESAHRVVARPCGTRSPPGGPTGTPWRT